MSLGRAIVVVAALTVAIVIAVLVIGSILTANVDGTVIADNPAYPGDSFCENSHYGINCDEPETVERDIDSFIRPAISELAVTVAVGMPISWLLFGLAFHAGSWLAGGEGGVGRSLAVAAWGMAPAIVVVPIALAVLAVSFDPVTVSPGTDPTAFQERLLAQLNALRVVGPVLGIATSLWGGVIWWFGLREAKELSASAATAVAGVFTLVELLFVLT